MPEPVFVQRGEQSTTALTEALLRGPGPTLDEVSRSFIPPGLDFDLSVPVSEEGVADLSLRGYSGQLTPEASELMITQLAWTLRPGAHDRGDPGLHRRPAGHLRHRAEPVQRRRALGVRPDRPGLQLALLRPARRAARVRASPTRWRRSTGRWAPRELGVRSIAVNLDGTTVAAVSGAGDQALLVLGRRPAATGRGGRQRRRQPAAPGLGPRRPAVAGGRGRRRRGGVLRRRRQARARSTCRGVSGRKVTQFLVSRDGSRLVAVVRGRRATS